MMVSCKRLWRGVIIMAKADIFRTRVYAVLRGMELVDGDFMTAEHVVDGRLKDERAYAVRAKKLFPHFIPRTIEIYSQRVSMDLEMFYKYATFEDPQKWDPDEHTRKQHAEVENNDGM